MKYLARTNVNHNQDLYPVGAEIELSSDEAAPLLECKAIEPLHKPFFKASEKPTSEGEANV